jgi:hypothetical protein
MLAAQAVMPPPPVLMVQREEVKPGRGAAHEATEAAWAKALVRGRSKDFYIGMDALTGPNEAWFILGYASYADMEAKHNEFAANPAFKQEIGKIAQQDGDLLSGTRSYVAAFRKDLSYGSPVELGKMRYFRVRTFRIRPGQNKTFEDGIKMALEAYAKIQLPNSFAFYEVTAGMPSPTYVVFRPMKSLDELDVLAATDKPFQEALGEEGRKAMQKIYAEAVNGVENQVFAFNPKLSYPAAAVVASDPAFWTPKPVKEGK